ncbi:microfibril-associated glycoprotein 4-like [Bombina bombina]|uniref:microfibril-associated glycoprotein 4-like n=1 Tax=Bombina bombina TaxID=8345 RepID=UPI00235A79F3|nr:microfibril-associated glycoprotein 4-like [Bombina bombina]
MQNLFLYVILLTSLERGQVTLETLPKNQNNVGACMDSCYPHDCSDVFRGQGLTSDGVYLIYPNGPYSPAVPVFCDMTSPGGPWTVFQKRFDGSVDFYRYWEGYKDGFGHADGEYWLGLKNIHFLTQKRMYCLRIDMEDFENETRFVTYDEFSISPLAISAEEDRYKLHVKGFREGDKLNPAGDSLVTHNGKNFSTYDHDGDTYAAGNCALSYSGAFWYSSCHNANLNGKYLKGTTDIYGQGITWRSWRGYYYSLKRSEMKIATCV